MNRTNKQNGQAILLVLTILGVVSVIGFTFLYMIRVQLRGADSYLARLQTKYLAEAGINHAKELIEFDAEAEAIDSYSDIWRTAFEGTDVDLDRDGTPDSKWIYVKDNQGNDIGRYAVLVSDESAKGNINSAGEYSHIGLVQGYSTYEISLAKLFDNLGLNGQSIASDILDYRYGPDKKPGQANKDDNNNNHSLEVDSFDNDADGTADEANEGIDEPGEFNIEAPLGDDQPFLVVDEIKSLSSITASELDDISRFLTVSSKDREVDAKGALRQNINYIKSDNLIKVMLDKSVADCWQKAANIIDSLDTNHARTKVFNHYNRLQPQSQQAGDWVWSSGRFECGMSAGQGSWSWQGLPFNDGDYYCFIYGLEEKPLGDVTINGARQTGMISSNAFIKGEGQKVRVENNSFSLSIQNNEAFGTICYFSYVELIPEKSGPGSAMASKEFNGVEAVRINEIMVKPTLEKNATEKQSPGGLWNWQGGYFVNSSPESGQEGEGTWIFSDIPNGYYYLKLIGKGGEFVGDVEVNGRIQASMRHGENFTAFDTVAVNSNRIEISIQNNFSDKTCYFKGIVLSQQPDTEYVELLNISGQAIDLSGWMLETTGQEAVTAFIPQGTSIASYGYLLLCVDKNDLAQGIGSNRISFMDTWAAQPAVQLDFFRALDRNFDFLKDSPVEDENFLILKDAQDNVVDKVEYLQSQSRSFYSLERGDPTQQTDNNGNFEFDGWFNTLDLSGGTPGKDNDNIGMDKDQFSDHNIREVTVRDSLVSNLLDLASVSVSDDWQNLGIADLSLMVDSLVVFGSALYPADKNISGWTDIFAGSGGYYSDSLGEEGVWRWENVENGNFLMSIKGEPDEAITVSYKKADGYWQVMAQGVIPDPEGMVYVGVISIGTGKPAAAPDKTLEIRLQNASSSETAHFYLLRLDPFANIYGRININTAPREVLLALPYVDNQAASYIIDIRPIGIRNNFYRGVGDLFLSDIFNNDPERNSKLGILSNLITVRSNVFEIISRAQVLEQDQPVATQEVKTIIERQ